MDTNQETIITDEEMTQEAAPVVEEQTPQSENVEVSPEVDEVEMQDSNEEFVDEAATEEVEAAVKPTIDAEYVANLFEQMIERFEKKIATDDHKNQLFDKMYAELDSYKKDIYAKMLKPFIMETILLIEDTARFIDKMESYEPEKISKYVQGIPDDLINLLEMNDVELYEEDGDVFNARVQRAVKLIETDSVELDNKIESRLRKGYRWNGVIIRPEAVQVYKYKEQNNN